MLSLDKSRNDGGVMLNKKEVTYAAWFQQIEGIGDRTLYALGKAFESFEDAYKAKEETLKMVLNEKQFLHYKESKQKVTPKEYMEVMLQKGIRYVPHFDAVFPNKLLHIPNPPFALFVKGNLPQENRPSVAMIGTRACSEYGKEVASYFAGELAKYGVQVVSGMARGIDAISQANCLKAGGDTYAVLGCGVDICYPSEYRKLYDNISMQGGVISTYIPGTQPQAGYFPARNRIISGLSDVVLVVEAGNKSGTLITVDMALEQGREVAVIPGRITDRLSHGCLKLLKQGASVVLDIDELLELIKENFSLQPQFDKIFGDKYKFGKSGIDFNKNISLSKEQKSVLQILSKEPKDAEKLYELWMKNGASGTFTQFLEVVMDLELLDLCKSNKNFFYIR